MKLWLIKRTDETDYDETHVRADNITISEVTPEGEPGLIISDVLNG
jgi:hypothetical protein